MMNKNTPNLVDLYIAEFPDNVQQQLQNLRKIILQTVPNAEEIISYKMPAYKVVESLVYFAGYKNHIGFYPTGSGIAAFEPELGNYKYSKGAVQFEIDKELPHDLIVRMVKYRLASAIAKHESKKVLKTCKNGHQFYKSSNCKSCPVCEAENKPKDGFMANISAPARRALVNNKINSLTELAQYTEKEILALHGIGPTVIPKLKAALKDSGLSFRKK